MDRIAEESLLFDYYGKLLTERKRKVMELYHEEDLSLSEIAEEFGISRTAVYDSLKSAEKQLASYEEKLGLVQRFLETERKIREANAGIERLCTSRGDDAELTESLGQIKSLLAGLAEE